MYPPIQHLFQLKTAVGSVLSSAKSLGETHNGVHLKREIFVEEVLPLIEPIIVIQIIEKFIFGEYEVTI